MSSTAQASSNKDGYLDSDGEEIPRTPRRTPMACQFCRGRKLKCDGLKPSCTNCNKRGVPCAYTPVPKQ